MSGLPVIKKKHEIQEEWCENTRQISVWRLVEKMQSFLRFRKWCEKHKQLSWNNANEFCMCYYQEVESQRFFSEVFYMGQTTVPTSQFTVLTIGYLTSDVDIGFFSFSPHEYLLVFFPMVLQNGDELSTIQARSSIGFYPYVATNMSEPVRRALMR